MRAGSIVLHVAHKEGSVLGQDITVIIRMVDTLEGQDLEDQEDTRMSLEGRQVGWCIGRVGMGRVVMEDLEGWEALVDLKAGSVGLGGMVDSMESREGVGCMVVRVVQGGRVEDQEDLAGLDERFSELI
jgi:hypothetical protein